MNIQPFNSSSNNIRNMQYRQNVSGKNPANSFFNALSLQADGKSVSAKDLKAKNPEQKDGLETEDYDYLASKFDPRDMTQKEYDEFLDYLQSKNVISQEDKTHIGYNGIMRADKENSVYYSPEIPTEDYYANGNMYGYAKYNSLLSCEEPSSIFTHSKSLYGKIASIFEQIIKMKK